MIKKTFDEIKIIGIVFLILFLFFIFTKAIQLISHSIDESNELSQNTKYEEVVEDILIVALADNESVEGHSIGGGSSLIFVQSGKVNEELYYRFMMKNEDDGKMLYHQLKADETYIYEFDDDSGEVPHIEVTWSVKTVYGEIVSSTGLFTSPDRDFDGFSNITGSIKSISIHVPKGTIDKSFSVDFE